MDPRSSGQDIVRCVLCEAEASLFCEDCCKHLCKNCVATHISSRSRAHNLLPLDQYLITPKCQDHQTKLCDYFCENCVIPVCSKCAASGRHKKHDVVDLKEKYEKKVTYLKSDLDELEKCIYPKYQNALSDIQCQKEMLCKNLTKLKISLNKQKTKWHKEVDNIVQKIQSDIDSTGYKQLATLEHEEENYKHNINIISKKIEDVKKSLNSVEHCLSFKYNSRNKEFKKMPSKPCISYFNFEPKEIDGKQLFGLFGSLSYTPKETMKHDIMVQSKESMISPPNKKLLNVPVLVKDIDTSYEKLHSVTCLSDEQIWSCGLDSVISLYSLQGEVLALVKSATNSIPQDIALTQNGELAFTEYGNRSINIVKNSKVETMVKLQGWKPWGLSNTYLGDLLVFMVSEDNKQSKVVRYFGSTEKQSIQWDEEGKPLFPGGRQNTTKYIAENRNFDICVAAHAVVVVTFAGKLRFRYLGNANISRESFDPVGIATDNQGNILTTDCYNRLIHILNQDGDFVRYIDNCDLDRPWGICTNMKDDLFVVVNNGRVKMIKYYV